MALRDFDLIEDLKPIGGGWRFMQVQKDGSFQRIPSVGGAPTARNLVEQVKTFRTNEGLLMGDVEREIADYIRKVSPNNDRFRGKGGILATPRPEPFVPLIQRIREWVDSVSPQRPKTLTKFEANERAAICIKCPQNVKWKTPCGECNKTVDYIGTTMRGVAVYELDDALLGCRLHSLHLPSAVFLDRDFLPPKLPTAPPPCWLQESVAAE